MLRRSARRLRPGECPIDNEVETIILKALAKERERRYQSAGELARDIEHYLAGEPIEAKRDRGWYLLSKAVRRYRARIAVTAVAVLLVIFSAFQLLARHRERSARVTAERRSLLLEADSRLNAGDYEGALQTAQGILEDAPRELEASLVQARALVNLGREQEAYDKLMELRSVHAGQAAVYELLAEIGTRSDPDQSRRYLSTARQLRKAGSPQDHYLRSLASMDDREAIRLLTETLERDPGHFAALMARAVRYYRTRNFEGMRIDAERARTLRPDDWRAWYNLGTALYRLQSHEEALTALERSLGLNPDYASAWYNLGMAARSDDDPQRALAAFGRAVELDPRHPRAQYQLGKVLHGMKRFSEAREAFEGAVTVDQDFFGSHYYLGLCHEALGNYAAALEAYDDCLDLKGAPRGTVLVGIGRARKSLGNAREALAAYAQAITEAEDHADAQAYVSALNDSAWLYLTAPSDAVRDYERALAMARKAAEASPTPDARILGTLALAELRAGDYTAARCFARQALERGGESSWDLLVCARAELELGNVDEARRLWDRLRALLPGEETPDQTLRAFWAESKKRFTEALPEEHP